MSPSSGVASGALWYKTILRSTVCSGTSFHDKKAEGYDSAPDQLNWAFVASSAARSYTVRVTSNCKVIYGGAVYVGLNRGSASRVEAGAQMLELLNERGTVVFSASGGRCITSRKFNSLQSRAIEGELLTTVPRLSARLLQSEPTGGRVEECEQRCELRELYRMTALPCP